MKQNKNKNITKITSGALVLLLASGCYIGNSNAEGSRIEGEDINVSGTITESKKEDTIADALNKSETTKKQENDSSDKKDDLNKLPSDEGSVAKPEVNEEVKDDQPIVPDNSSDNKNNTGDNKENPAESTESQSSQSDKK